jgi:hypothetical protein
VSKRNNLVTTLPDESLRPTLRDVAYLHNEATADKAIIHLARAVNAHNPASLPL